MDLEEFAKIKASYLATVREKGKEALTKAFQEAFDACPKLLELHWTQYTPWFNDGNACVFGVHDIHVMTEDVKAMLSADDEQRECFERGWFEDAGLPYIGQLKREKTWNDKPNPLYDPEMGEVLGRLDDMVRACEDVMQLALGDHARVRVYRTDEGVEFEVEEYSHD